MSIKIEVAETHEVERGGGAFTADVSKYPADILARIFHEGVKTVVGDTASGATAEAYGDGWAKLSKEDKAAWKARNESKVAEHANAAMEAKHKKLADGEWSMRGTGDGYTEVDREAFSLAFFKAAGHNDGRPVSARYIVRVRDRDAFKGMPDGEFQTFVAEWISTLPEKTRNALYKQAEESLARKRAEAERLANEAINVNVEI